MEDGWDVVQRREGGESLKTLALPWTFGNVARGRCLVMIEGGGGLWAGKGCLEQSMDE